MSARSLFRVTFLVLVSLALPSIILSVPGWINERLHESEANRVQRESEERRRIVAPLTDLAPRQATPKAHPQDAPHEQLRRRKADRSIEWNRRSEWSESGESTSPRQRLDLTYRQPTREERIAAHREYLELRNLSAGRRTPSIPPAGTQSLVQPEAWPDPPDPYAEPVSRHPRRDRHEHGS